MSLLVVDVFESYYEGRKTPFPADAKQTEVEVQRDGRKTAAKDEKPGYRIQNAA